MTLEERIAQEFINVLRTHVTDAEWSCILAANSAETDPRVCHSHDFCDANMAMAEAFRRCGLGEVDLQDDNMIALWNKAWDIASEELK